MPSLGTLTYDLIAKIGGFTDGMTQAERQADKSAKAINSSIASIGVAGYAAGNALGQYLKQGIDAAINAFPELIDQAAKFQDLADKTGGSAEGFANFAVSAKVAGVSIDSVADASVRLSKSLLQAGDDSKQITAGLKALNLPIDEFKRLKPDEQIKAVANAFGNYADGADKAAVAQQLFGRSGAELLKFFKDYTDNGGDVTILTAKMIGQADDFGDAMARQRAELSLLASALATQAIDPITALTGVVKDAIKEFVGLSDAGSDLGANDAVRKWAEDLGRTFAQLLDYIVQSKKELSTLNDLGNAVDKSLKTFSFKPIAEFQDKNGLDAFFRGKDASIGTADKGIANLDALYGKRAASAADSFVSSYDRRLKESAASRNDKATNAFYGIGQDGRPQLRATAPPKKSGSGGADDPTKKLLDNDLAAFKAQADQAKELLADRNKILDLYNQQGLLSVRDYYAALQGNLDEATAAQAKSYDDQIAALTTFRDAAKKETDAADATGKINKLQDDKAKLYRQAGNEAIAMSVKEGVATKAVSAAFGEVNAKILEFNGNLREAAAIRFDASNEKLMQQAVAEGNQEIVERIKLLKQYTLAQADIDKATQGFALAQGDLQLAEDRLTIAQQRGTMGEIELLNASGAARRAAIGPMQQELDTLLAINDAVRTPQQNQQIERLKSQLEGLKATADPLADRFNTIFSDAAGNAFSSFIDGTKTAKEAFKDFATSVTSEIGNMVAKNLAKKLFSSVLGGEDVGGGIGGLLSSLFGGGSGGGSGGDALGSFITAKGFAGGGYTGMGAANDPAGIVHKNEVVWSQGDIQNAGGVGNVEAMRRGAGGGGLVVNFALQGRMDPSTQTQIAQKVRRETLTAAARF